MTPIEQGMIRAAERHLGRPLTADELEKLLPSPVAALHELVEALRDYSAENRDPTPDMAFPQSCSQRMQSAHVQAVAWRAVQMRSQAALLARRTRALERTDGPPERDSLRLASATNDGRRPSGQHDGRAHSHEAGAGKREDCRATLVHAKDSMARLTGSLQPDGTI
jgi:hypothetical protein